MKTIEWKTFEYAHRKRTLDWYWAVGIIAIAVAIAATILGNFLFGLLILLALFALMLYAHRPPRSIEIEANEIGIRVDSNFFPYQNLESFCVQEVGPDKKLFLKSKKMLMPLLSLPVAPEVNTSELRELMLPKIAEEYLDESFFEKLLDKWGF